MGDSAVSRDPLQHGSVSFNHIFTAYDSRVAGSRRCAWEEGELPDNDDCFHGRYYRRRMSAILCQKLYIRAGYEGYHGFLHWSGIPDPEYPCLKAVR